MESYSKGMTYQDLITRDNIPILDLPRAFIWMNVNARSKTKNVISVALKKFQTERCIVWSGSGSAVEKTLTCVEIMKSRFKSLHQINSIGYRRIMEYWDPNIEGLDQLVAIREIPTIHVILSKDPLDCNNPGYQPPEERVANSVPKMKPAKPVSNNADDQGSKNHHACAPK